MTPDKKKPDTPRKPRRMTVALPDRIKLEVEKCGDAIGSRAIATAAVEEYVRKQLPAAAIAKIIRDHLDAKLGMPLPEHAAKREGWKKGD